VPGAVRRSFAAAALALFVSACASTPPPDPATQLPELELRIYELVNAQRQALAPGAKDLALDSELVGIARQRSADMAAKDAYAAGDPHISAARLMAEDEKFQGLLGENVAAQRYAKTTGIDVEQCAARIVATWVGSPTHKENLSFAEYGRTGVGAALSGDTVFVTQLFAAEIAYAPKSEPAHNADPAASRPPAARVQRHHAAVH
jgi:uncharacterized protein YkwD